MTDEQVEKICKTIRNMENTLVFFGIILVMIIAGAGCIICSRLDDIDRVMTASHGRGN